MVSHGGEHERRAAVLVRAVRLSALVEEHPDGVVVAVGCSHVQHRLALVDHTVWKS